MSSTYLTSTNMTMIERLLSESRGHPRIPGRKMEEARFLINQFQGGTTGEGDLRELLDAHLRENETCKGNTSRRLGGDVVRRAARLLFGSRFSDRRPSRIAAGILASRPSQNEAQRRIHNDTDGRQRRNDDIKSRNQLH